MKVCRLCKVEKSLDEFHNMTRSKDGKQSRCKSCAIDLARRWYSENKERAAATCREYRAANAESVTEYHANYYQRNAEKWRERAQMPEVIERRNVLLRERMMDPQRRDAKRAQDRDYYQKNADRLKAQANEYERVQRMLGNPQFIQRKRESNRRRRARMSNADVRMISHRDWNRLVQGQDGKCWYCKQDATLTLDHLIPLARGGRHAIGNIVAACQPCNSAKRDLLPIEFRAGRSHTGCIGRSA